MLRVARKHATQTSPKSRSPSRDDGSSGGDFRSEVIFGVQVNTDDLIALALHYEEHRAYLRSWANIIKLKSRRKLKCRMGEGRSSRSKGIAALPVEIFLIIEKFLWEDFYGNREDSDDENDSYSESEVGSIPESSSGVATTEDDSGTEVSSSPEGHEETPADSAAVEQHPEKRRRVAMDLSRPYLGWRYGYRFSRYNFTKRNWRRQHLRIGDCGARCVDDICKALRHLLWDNKLKGTITTDLNDEGPWRTALTTRKRGTEHRVNFPDDRYDETSQDFVRSSDLSCYDNVQEEEIESRLTDFLDWSGIPSVPSPASGPPRKRKRQHWEGATGVRYMLVTSAKSPGGGDGYY